MPRALAIACLLLCPLLPGQEPVPQDLSGHRGPRLWSFPADAMTDFVVVFHTAVGWADEGPGSWGAVQQLEQAFTGSQPEHQLFDLRTGSGPEDLWIAASAPVRDWRLAIARCAGALTEPAFETIEPQRVPTGPAPWQRPPAVQLLFPDHPLGRPPWPGTPCSVDGVRAFHAEHFTLDRVTVAWCGPVPPKETRRLIEEALAALPLSGPARSTPEPPRWSPGERTWTGEPRRDPGALVFPLAEGSAAEVARALLFDAALWSAGESGVRCTLFRGLGFLEVPLSPGLRRREDGVPRTLGALAESAWERAHDEALAPFRPRNLADLVSTTRRLTVLEEPAPALYEALRVLRPDDCIAWAEALLEGEPAVLLPASPFPTVLVLALVFLLVVVVLVDRTQGHPLARALGGLAARLRPGPRPSPVESVEKGDVDSLQREIQAFYDREDSRRASGQDGENGP